MSFDANSCEKIYVCIKFLYRVLIYSWDIFEEINIKVDI